MALCESIKQTELAKNQKGDFLFRGQSTDEPLIPYIARLKPKGKFKNIERLLMAEFERQRLPFTEFEPDNKWDRLALAQHHGLPTRLLDWSYSALAALWFCVKSPPKKDDKGKKLDGVVWLLKTTKDDFINFPTAREQVAIRLNDAKKNLVDTEQALSALQRQIQKVREDMKQNHQLFLDKLITPQGFANLYNPAEERLNQLLSELPKLEADVARLKVDQVSVEEVIFEAQHLYEQWPKLEVEKKRAIVESIFEKVEIGEGKINITYSGIPSSEELCKSQQQMAPATG